MFQGNLRKRSNYLNNSVLCTAKHLVGYFFSLALIFKLV